MVLSVGECAVSQVAIDLDCVKMLEVGSLVYLNVPIVNHKIYFVVVRSYAIYLGVFEVKSFLLFKIFGWKDSKVPIDKSYQNIFVWNYVYLIGYKSFKIYFCFGCVFCQLEFSVEIKLWKNTVEEIFFVNLFTLCLSSRLFACSWRSSIASTLVIHISIYGVAAHCCTRIVLQNYILGSFFFVFIKITVFVWRKVWSLICTWLFFTWVGSLMSDSDTLNERVIFLFSFGSFFWLSRTSCLESLLTICHFT